jgi:hypothetical protein
LIFSDSSSINASTSADISAAVGGMIEGSAGTGKKVKLV